MSDVREESDHALDHKLGQLGKSPEINENIVPDVNTAPELQALRGETKNVGGGAQQLGVEISDIPWRKVKCYYDSAPLVSINNTENVRGGLKIHQRHLSYRFSIDGLEELNFRLNRFQIGGLISPEFWMSRPLQQSQPPQLQTC